MFRRANEMFITAKLADQTLDVLCKSEKMLSHANELRGHNMSRHHMGAKISLRSSGSFNFRCQEDGRHLCQDFSKLYIHLCCFMKTWKVD